MKTIILDYGKEFSNWKSICNEHDIHIFFADPGCPSKRGLNENSNGLLKKDSLSNKWISIQLMKSLYNQSLITEIRPLESHWGI